METCKHLKNVYTEYFLFVVANTDTSIFINNSNNKKYDSNKIRLYANVLVNVLL